MNLQCRMDIANGWKKEKGERKVSFSYPAPENAKGFYEYGFEFENDSTANWMEWDSLHGEIRAAEDVELFEADLTVYLKNCNNARPFPSSASVHISVPINEFCSTFEILMENFQSVLAKKIELRYVSGLCIENANVDFDVCKLAARRAPAVYLDVPVRGLHGACNETVTYHGTVYNCTDAALSCSLSQAFEGWESMKAEIQISGEEKTAVLLPPEGNADFTVQLTLHDYMVPGGHENTLIKAVGSTGKMSGETVVTLKTMMNLPHPYIFHDEKGWAEVRRKVMDYPCYKGAVDGYIKAAEEWNVQPPVKDRPYCYDTKNEFYAMSAAYAYQLTGEKRYAEKVAQFFRYFTNDETGYMIRKRGCSQAYVQEGGFFQHLAVPYDLIYDADVLTDAEKQKVEDCFRLYMRILDWHLKDGFVSNWLVSEIEGALFCAMAIQDADLIERFVFGDGGLISELQYGTMNDGWWFECSVGYNVWICEMMLMAAHSLLPFGYNMIHEYFRIPYNQEVEAQKLGTQNYIPYGMANAKWGGNLKNYVCIKDLFDAFLPFMNSFGVVFGLCDSPEARVDGKEFFSIYDLAYTYYQDPAYKNLIRQNKPDPIFGHPELDKNKPAQAIGNPSDMNTLIPGEEAELNPNAYADNIGLMVLRSRKEGRKPSEQIQAVLRYGSHGYFHGHFDTASLLSIMRYGRSFYDPECCWWGYESPMYKFYVQSSVTSNMVVVDEKMQEPADSKRILFVSGDRLQAAGVEINTRWSNPPYGGIVYDGFGDMKEYYNSRNEEIDFAEGPDVPEYGTVFDYTESVLQRRIMAVADDYLVLFDSLQAEKEHTYSNLLHILGWRSLEGENITFTRHTDKMSDNPLSSTQFITDCNWYKVKGTSVARFEGEFGERHPAGDRTRYNIPGILKMDVHAAWPPETEQIIGRVATCMGHTRVPMLYQVLGDGKILAEGQMNGWVLGRREFDVAVRGKKELTLYLDQGYKAEPEKRVLGTDQCCFWGQIELELADGSRMDLGKLMQEQPELVKQTNIDSGCGIGKDYRGGCVTIVGTHYDTAIPASTVDHSQPGLLSLSLEGRNVVRVRGCVGVDAFPGDEEVYRKTYAVRTAGKNARFITVIEPYETENRILKVEAEGPDSVTVTLKDGRRQTITVSNMDKGKPEIQLTEA